MSEDKRILSHLKRGPITPMQAYRIAGCLALHSAISRLRKDGHLITCTMKSRGRKRWGEYRLQRRAHGSR